MRVWERSGRRQSRTIAEKKKSLSRESLKTATMYTELCCLHSEGKT